MQLPEATTQSTQIATDNSSIGILLGASIRRANGQLVGAYEERCTAAATAYLNRQIDWILISGDGHTPNYDEIQAARQCLTQRGVPNNAIMADHYGLRTRETILRSRALFPESSLHYISQRYHLRRVLYLAQNYDDTNVIIAGQGEGYSDIRERIREIFARFKAWLEFHDFVSF